MYIHDKLKNSEDENNINGDTNGEVEEKMNGEEKKENENCDHIAMKKEVHWNPFHYLSLIFKHMFGKSDINNKFKTLPTIRIAGTMDLLDSRLEDKGSISKKRI
jgi:hypothetical protein